MSADEARAKLAAAPDTTRLELWKHGGRPRRFVAYGYGFSGDFDTIEEARACIFVSTLYDPEWPCAIYERIDEVSR